MNKKEMIDTIFDYVDRQQDALYMCAERQMKKIGNSYNVDHNGNFQRYAALTYLLMELGLDDEYKEHWESVKDNFHPNPYRRESQEDK